MAELITLLSTSRVQWIVTLIAVDWILGAVAAILKKEFRLGKMAMFMGKGVIPYVLGFAVLEAVTQALPAVSWMASAAFVVVFLALVGSILNNLGKMGLSIPNYLKKE